MSVAPVLEPLDHSSALLELVIANGRRRRLDRAQRLARAAGPRPFPGESPDVNENQLSQSLRELKSAYAELLVLMDDTMRKNADEAASDETLIEQNAAVSRRMQSIEPRMRRFLSELGDWTQTRKSVSEPLRDEIDAFIDSLDQGLTAMQKRLADQVGAFRSEQSRLADSIRSMQKSRFGVHKYRGAKRDPRLFDSNA